MTDDEKDRRAGRFDPELAISIQDARDYTYHPTRTDPGVLATAAVKDSNLSNEIDWQVDRVLRTGIPHVSEEASE